MIRAIRMELGMPGDLDAGSIRVAFERVDGDRCAYRCAFYPFANEAPIWEGDSLSIPGPPHTVKALRHLLDFMDPESEGLADTFNTDAVEWLELVAPAIESAKIEMGDEYS